MSVSYCGDFSNYWPGKIVQSHADFYFLSGGGISSWGLNTIPATTADHRSCCDMGTLGLCLIQALCKGSWRTHCLSGISLLSKKQLLKSSWSPFLTSLKIFSFKEDVWEDRSKIIGSYLSWFLADTDRLTWQRGNRWTWEVKPGCSSVLKSFFADRTRLLLLPVQHF